MKWLVPFALVLLATLSRANPVVEKWANFKITHGKTYESRQEELKRLAIFEDNLKEIERHNQLYEKGQTSYKKGINKFADLTHEEFVQYVQKPHPSKPEKTVVPTEKFQKPSGAEIPDSIDWRETGAVGPVKDQGQCGSCWSFSTTGSLEGQLFLTKGELTLLSEQELVDCAKGHGNIGCGGGFMQIAFDYVIKHGITSEDQYPYEAINVKCRRTNQTTAFQITKYVEIEKFDEADLQAAVATVGPISVSIDAKNWHLYSEGIYDDQVCGNAQKDMIHAVLAVGYGSDEEKEFWILKNSWGEGWGEKGYIKTMRNTGNQCGVATDSSYPVV